MKLDVAGAHACIFSSVLVPVSRHRIAAGIKLRFNLDETVDGLAIRRFKFKFEQGRRPMRIEDRRLPHVEAVFVLVAFRRFAQLSGN